VTKNYRNIPRVATLAINVKGADLLFLDHLDSEALEEHDHKMWQAAGVDISKKPFKHVIVYVPLSDDGFNRNSLRSNSAADIAGYSETREFTLGIQDLWPYLDLFFDNRTTNMSILLAEIADHFAEEQPEGFTLADVLKLFKEQINLPKDARKNSRWADFYASTIQSVLQRFRSLPTTLSGLIDVTGKGFGFDRLTDLQPHDLIVVDIERIMANPSDPDVAESAIKIITAYILKQLTEAMTKRTCGVDNIIVFADELNNLAPHNGKKGIGEYLSQLARTTRDRSIVLFGAGQFRSGINEDILKAASVHYSLQTPEHELNDRIYNQLSDEFKARLTRLRPGEALLQYPSLRTAVFARFPRPFVMSGATKWQEQFPPITERDFAECIAKRLQRLDPHHPLRLDDVKQLIQSVLAPIDADAQQQKKVRAGILECLREIEIEYAKDHKGAKKVPWQQFSSLIHEKYAQQEKIHAVVHHERPSSFVEKDW
jgi:hypothetical protein